MHMSIAPSDSAEKGTKYNKKLGQLIRLIPSTYPTKFAPVKVQVSLPGVKNRRKYVSNKPLIRFPSRTQVYHVRCI